MPEYVYSARYFFEFRNSIAMSRRKVLHIQRTCEFYIYT